MRMKNAFMNAIFVLSIFMITDCQGLVVATRLPGDGGTGPGNLCPPGGCPVDCHANDDPHVKTFDGSYYEMQQQGRFYLYKHSTQPIWVQGFFQSCGYRGAFCSCGAAVRYFGETFVIDKCFKPNGIRANVVAKLGTGTSMKIGVFFAGYKISLPGALRVFLGSYGRGVGTITVQTNATDLSHIGGLCGYYDGSPFNDFTWRTGEVTTAGNVYPYDFADTWRVPPSEDLFVGNNLNHLSPCVEVANYTFVPTGVADACLLNVTPSDMIGSLPGDAPFARKRRKRQIGPDFPNGAWPNGWTHASAVSFCHDYLFASQAVITCTSNIPVVIDANPFIESCARDIQLTGGTSFASVSLTALQVKCLSTLQAYGISDNLIMQDLCPFNCSGNGQCSAGACTCNQGWYGISCSQATNEVPFITSASPSSNCPPSINGTKCYAAYLYGGPFVNTDTLSARGLANQVNNPVQPRNVQVQITYISSGVVSIRILVPKCSSPRVPFILAVSVSNNGQNYSAAWFLVFNV